MGRAMVTRSRSAIFMAAVIDIAREYRDTCSCISTQSIEILVFEKAFYRAECCHTQRNPRIFIVPRYRIYQKRVESELFCRGVENEVYFYWTANPQVAGEFLRHLYFALSADEQQKVIFI